LRSRKFELVISCECLGVGLDETQLVVVPFVAANNESMVDAARRAYHLLPKKKQHATCGGKSKAEIYVFAKELDI
jgi:hypothetical protein